ncbi:MAG TPA: ABC transporter permease subunit [Clostridia bacterium]|nr:ABC transporter permease subunit [Clostridia bacterium]
MKSPLHFGSDSSAVNHLALNSQLNSAALQPIALLELRRAARRPSTHRLRWIVLLATALPVLVQLEDAAGNGKQVFAFTAGWILVLCLMSGLFLTADSLSEERRAGTLGLLLLTGLKARDIVIGKLLANSVNAVYVLVAALPVVALSTLAGGLTPGELLRTSLALFNALFFSLALGTCVSVMSNTRTQALMRMVLALGLLCGIPLILDLVGTSFSGLTLPSPYTAYAWADGLRYQFDPIGFWAALGCSHALGWAAIVLASLRLHFTWQQGRRSSPCVPVFKRARSRSAIATRPQRREWLAINPVLWLLGDEPAIRRLLLLLVLAWGLAVTVASFLGPGMGMVMLQMGRLVGFGLKVVIAVQACRFFAEARKNGFLQLILATPLTTREILRGHWLSLKQTFLWPVVLFLTFCFAPSLVPARAASGASLLTGPETGFGIELGFAAATALTTLADIAALCYFGTWLSLVLKHPGYAALIAITSVLILPSFLCCGALPSLGFGGPDLVIDALLILWARDRFKQDFRLKPAATKPK